VQWLLHYGVEVPLGWVEWNVDLPQWLHDYIAAGIVLWATFMRLLWSSLLELPASERALFVTSSLAVMICGWWFWALALPTSMSARCSNDRDRRAVSGLVC